MVGGADTELFNAGVASLDGVADTAGAGVSVLIGVASFITTSSAAAGLKLFASAFN